MANKFYTAEEAAKRLNLSEEQLKSLVREGKLREFRDAGKSNYKVGDIDSLAVSVAAEAGESSTAGASASGEVVLEPVEDSSVELSPSASDVVSLDDTAEGADDTASGTTAVTKVKESTVVPSIGVNVFDDDELDEQVDPLAQTAVTDVAGLGMDTAGSGSGILDLTLEESDDTSLGRELLDEIYTDGDKEGSSAVDMGDDTRAGLDEAVPTEPAEGEEIFEPEVAAADEPKAVVRQVMEYGPDAVSTSLTALMIVTVVVLWFAGLGSAALVRGMTPALIQAVYDKLWLYTAGAVVVSVATVAGTYFFAVKRSERSG